VKQTDTTVVQAWIAERGAKFKLDSKQLVGLADAGVPGSVIDVIVGVSYPEHFALQQRPMGPTFGDDLTASDSARLAMRYLADRCNAAGYNSFVYSVGVVDPCAVLYGSQYRNGYGYGYGNGFGYGNGYGYSGFNSYGGFNDPYGYNSGYYAPIVIVKGDQPAHGRVVNGHGYSSGSSSGSSASGTGSSASSSSSGSGSGSSSGSGSASSAPASSSGGDGGRTAHPRPPE
jgi:hypothetical protein